MKQGTRNADLVYEKWEKSKVSRKRMQMRRERRNEMSDMEIEKHCKVVAGR